LAAKIAAEKAAAENAAAVKAAAERAAQLKEARERAAAEIAAAENARKERIEAERVAAEKAAAQRAATAQKLQALETARLAGQRLAAQQSMHDSSADILNNSVPDWLGLCLLGLLALIICLGAVWIFNRGDKRARVRELQTVGGQPGYGQPGYQPVPHNSFRASIVDGKVVLSTDTARNSSAPPGDEFQQAPCQKFHPYRQRDGKVLLFGVPPPGNVEPVRTPFPGTVPSAYAASNLTLTPSAASPLRAPFE